MRQVDRRHLQYLAVDPLTLLPFHGSGKKLFPSDCGSGPHERTPVILAPQASQRKRRHELVAQPKELAANPHPQAIPKLVRIVKSESFSLPLSHVMLLGKPPPRFHYSPFTVQRFTIPRWGRTLAQSLIAQAMCGRMRERP